jgi:hypothetical protein
MPAVNPSGMILSSPPSIMGVPRNVASMGRVALLSRIFMDVFPDCGLDAVQHSSSKSMGVQKLLSHAEHSVSGLIPGSIPGFRRDSIFILRQCFHQ